MLESIRLNPKEYAPGREEINLHELGVELRQSGASWGEAQVAVEMTRQQVGAVVTDRHLTPVEMSIPLMLSADGDTPVAEAIYRIQSFVGLAQSDEYEPCWIARDFSTASGHAGSVGYQVLSASLTGIEGWQLAHHQQALEVELKLTRSPLCYAAEEIEGPVHKLESGRALVFEEEDTPSTGPGLIRLRVKNTGEQDLRGMVVALESRDHPQDASKDTTAKLHYECEALTLSGGTSKATRTGASGGGSNNVARATLTAGWLTILSSEIAGVGHMTHIGVRRLRFRVFDGSSAPGTIQLRAQYRPLGGLAWSDAGGTVAIKVVGDFHLLDLGECRPERATVGDQRWEWRVLARAPGGSGTIDLDCVSIEPVEQHALVRAPFVAPQPDLQEQQSPGTGVDDDSLGTVPWESPERVKVSDGERARASLTSLATSHYLKATNYGFEIPPLATVTGVVVDVEGGPLTSNRVRASAIRLVTNGTIGSTDRATPDLLPNGNQQHLLYGSSTDSWGVQLTPAIVNAEGFGVAVAYGRTTSSAGTVFMDIDNIVITVYYSEPGSEGGLCFSSRSIEFRTDGVHRQHPTNDVWGELVNEGQHLYSPPSFLEDRATRALILPTAGDLDVLPDSGTHSLEAQKLTRPAYAYAREALKAEGE